MQIEEFSCIRVYALSTSAYTSIDSPGPYNYFEIIGTSDGSAMTRSSDGTDAHSYPFPSGGWYGFLAGMSPWSMASSTRYAKSDIATYLKASAGTPNVYVEWSK